MAAQTQPDRGGRGPRWSSLAEFLHDEAVGGVVLVAATVVALVWANSGAADSYVRFWHHELTLGSGSHAVTEDLVGWVNEGLMTIFFFVVGLEIKRELVVGELREPRAAALPMAAAAGGAVLPAVLFLLLAPPGDASRGWGVPMATDIAFAVGVLALVGRRVSGGAKLFLLSIAIVDDLIAIVVIAFFYSGSLHLAWLLLPAAGVGLVLVMRRFVGHPLWYVPVGVLVWFGLLESGVAATLAGVALGLLTPTGRVHGRDVLADLEHLLHPVSAYVVVPLFALANAGIDLRGGVLSDALTQRLTWAVAVALVVGKTVGIAGATFVLLRTGWVRLPAGMARREVWPLAVLGGIGFTVALFIADLAFTDPVLVTQAKVGIFLASAFAAACGAGLMLVRRGD